MIAKPPILQRGLRWYWWPVLAATGGLLLVRQVGWLFATVVTGILLLWQNPKVQVWVWTKSLRREIHQPQGPPPRPAAPAPAGAQLATNAAPLRTAAELFRTTNVWDVHLRFTSNQWAALQPKSVPPILNFLQPDGSAILRNPAASRAGLAGVIGIDLPWSAGDVEFGGVALTKVAARFKGNGTFLGAVRSYKRPFKLDLNQHVAGQQLAERGTLNFHNLVADDSFLRDTLAYEFFRAAGVPASRTAFARLRLTVDGWFEDRLLGLYAMVENVDAAWAREQFGTNGTVIFKPVTPDLFADLGDDWAAYAPIYDPKTRTTPAQQRRLMALARLVSGADQADFARQIGEFVDVPAFVSFLACEAMLSNYDSILSNGQNFLLYLEPRSQRFGFIPWDHDHCWGQFPFLGTADERARASLRQPWVGTNRFLARMLEVPAVRQEYETELKRLRETLFIPERLGRRVDELAVVIRPFVAEEPDNRLAKFERATGLAATNQPAGPVELSFKQFFAARAASVSAQLQGKAEGVILQRKRRH
jgi:spore coat protein H